MARWIIVIFQEVRMLVMVMFFFSYGIIPLWSYLETKTSWGGILLWGPEYWSLAMLFSSLLAYNILFQIMILFNYILYLCCKEILFAWFKDDPTCTRYACAYFGPRDPWLTLTSNLGMAAYGQYSAHASYLGWEFGPSSCFKKDKKEDLKESTELPITETV